MQNNVSSLESNLRQVRSERDELEAARATLKAEIDKCTQNFKLAQNKNDQLVSELAAAARAEETARAEARSANQRAEEAEKSQRDLQEEGSRLLSSLDEMRPKFVELTGLKLDLTEKIDALMASLKERDSTIADLERQLENAQEAASAATRDHEHEESRWIKEKANAEKSLDELQKSYIDLQQELAESLASSRELESDRKSQRQNCVRLQEELDIVKAKERAHDDELISLQARLDEERRAGQESETLLEQLQADIESLRTELANRDAEINRLRQSASSPPSPLPQSLDGEVQKALKQQYDFDISSAQSTIRDLETQLYDAESHYHALQKQYAAVEEELRQLRAIVANQRPHSTASREFRQSHRTDELRRTSFGSQRSGSLPRTNPSIRIDENLPPATKHQRHVSLAMLQARMASEAEAVTNATLRTHSSPRAVPPSIEELPSRSSLDSSIPSYNFKKPQFLDESHVFWCASCKGDLIIL